MVTIRVPVPSGVAIANLLGVLGLVAVVAAVGGLAGIWWAVLAGGACLVGLSVIAATYATDPVVDRTADPAAPATAAVAPVAVAAEQRAA